MQGVGFRFAARTQARCLGLGGWVRNTADRADEFIAWCRSGPPGARVSEVQIEWCEDQARIALDETDFEITL